MISIEKVVGGFLIEYSHESISFSRIKEIVVTERKLLNRIKELIHEEENNSPVESSDSLTKEKLEISNKLKLTT